MINYTIVEQNIKQLKSHAKHYGVSYELKCYFLSQTWKHYKFNAIGTRLRYQMSLYLLDEFSNLIEKGEF